MWMFYRFLLHVMFSVSLSIYTRIICMPQIQWNQTNQTICQYYVLNNPVKIRAVVQVLTRRRRNLWLKPKEKENADKRIMPVKGTNCICYIYIFMSCMSIQKENTTTIESVHSKNREAHNWLYFYYVVFLRVLCHIYGPCKIAITNHNIYMLRTPEYEFVISTKRWRSWAACAAHTWNPTSHRRSSAFWTWRWKWSWRWSSKSEVIQSTLHTFSPTALVTDSHPLLHVFRAHKTERNLNPKAACLKRREEEKSEDGAPKLSQHHMLPNGPYPAMPVSNITFDF